MLVWDNKELWGVTARVLFDQPGNHTFHYYDIDDSHWCFLYYFSDEREHHGDFDEQQSQAVMIKNDQPSK